MTLSELLDRLREVDPETWQILDLTMCLSAALHEIDPDAPAGQDLIQGEIQRAIERHGDDWGVSKDGMRNGKPHYIADIWVGGNVSDDDCSGHGDSPAEALLSAYIAVMEARKK